jgi:hypothetical protein
MNRKRIILIFLGASILISIVGLIFSRINLNSKNSANYSVTEITGDCEKSGDSQNKDKCYQQLFVLYNKQEKKDCTIFSGDSGVVCEKAKLVENAVTNKNENDCQKLEADNEKQSCEAQVLYSLAISNRDAAYCEKIKQPEISTDCRSVIDKITSVKTNI